MADLNEVRAAVAEGNAARDALAAELRNSGTELATARRERDRLRDAGADPAEVQAAGDRVQALHATKLGLSDQLGLAHTGIADRLEQLLGNEIDLEGDVPLVLLPVRIEVRSTADQTALRVRIFPDTVHGESLESGLTESEVAAGKLYWDAVWTSGDPAASWPTLQKAVGLRRAPWVAETLRPINLLDRPAGFPQYNEPDAPARLPSVARTLPDRFLIRIEQDGADPVTVHTRPIPDQVPVGLAAVDQLETLKVGDEDLPVMDESLRWLVDYDHAVELGLAVTVPLPVPGQSIERVLAFGVRAGLSAAAGAARLEGLLRSHRFTDGAEFLPQGTPTNNTDTVRPEWSRRTPLGPPSLVAATALPAGANGAVTAGALGLDPALVATLAHAEDTEQARAGAFNTSLWATTWGDAIEMLTPLGVMNHDNRLDTPSIDAIRDHWIGHVRGRGPLPAIRLGRQPYGLLPIVATDRTYQPFRGDFAETRLVPWLHGRRWMWEDAVSSVPTVMDGPLDDALPKILGTDAVLRGLRVRTAISPDPLLKFAAERTLDGTPARQAQQQIAGAAAILVGVGEESIENNFLTGKKTRTLALPLVDDTDQAFVQRLADGVPPGGVKSVLQVLLLHANVVNADAVTRVASKQAMDGTLRAAIAETETGVDRDLIAQAVQAVQAEAFDDGLIADAASQIEREVGRLDARKLADRHPLPGLAPPTAVQQLAGVEPEVRQLIGPAGMRVVGELLRKAQWRAAFLESLRVIAGIDSAAERRLLLAETLDCCSHRLDAWLISAASRRLADLRTRRPDGAYLGAYGVIEHIELSAPTPDGQIDGRDVLHDPGDGGFVHAPGLNHAATAGVLRSGRLTHRRGDPSSEALDIDLSSTRVRDAISLLDGMRRGQTLGALLGYRLERRLHERSGGPDALELDRFIYVLRIVAPLRVGKLTDPGAPAQESLAASNVVDGLKLLDVPTAKVTQAMDDGPKDRGPEGSPYITNWNKPTPGEQQAVLAAIEELRRTHDAVADLLLAESVHQVVNGNPPRAAAAMDALAAGESVPPQPEVVKIPRTGVPIQHRVALILPAPLPPTAAGWAADAPRAVAEPGLEAWAQGALGDPEAIPLAVGDPRTLADASLSALDVLYDADGDSVATSTLAARLRMALPGLGEDLSPLAVTWEIAGLLRGLLVSGRRLDVADVGRPAEDPQAEKQPIGRLPDAAELLGRATAARASLADAAVPADPAQLLAFGVRRPPTGAVELSPDEQDLAGEALIAEAGRRIDQADSLLAKAAAAETPRAMAELAGQALAVIFGSGFVAIPVLLPPPAGEPDLWTEAVTSGVQAKPGAEIRPWLARAGTLRTGASAYGESLLIREAYGSRPVLRTVQSPAAAYGSWVGLEFPDGKPPLVPIASMVAEVVGAGDLGGSVAGLVVDEWTEVVPRRLERLDPGDLDKPAELVDVTTTGVALHANGPGARPPQSILLAMTPDGGNWTADRLVAVIDEALALARIRCVTLEQIPFAGRFLPALYFRDWSLQGEPALNWSEVATASFSKSASMAFLKVQQ